jgi:hypothetical protein
MPDSTRLGRPNPHGRRSPRLLILTSVLLSDLGPRVWQPQVLGAWHFSFYLLFLNQKLSLILKELYVVSTVAQQSACWFYFILKDFIFNFCVLLSACMCLHRSAEPARRGQKNIEMPWSGNYRWSCAAPGVMGIILQPSPRAAHGLTEPSL